MPRWPKRTEEERFWARVQKTDGCWLWMGARKQGDYGRFFPGKPGGYLAHVYAYMTVNGPVPKGLELDHLCRNPPCVRPDHLEGTYIHDSLD